MELQDKMAEIAEHLDAAFEAAAAIRLVSNEHDDWDVGGLVARKVRAAQVTVARSMATLAEGDYTERPARVA